MTGTPTPRELAELTVRRLNRASVDLGLTPADQELFSLVPLVIDISDEEAESAGVAAGEYEVFDIELFVDDFDAYADLATKLEKLAERLQPEVPQPGPGQLGLPGLDTDD